jgi:hypothetical protein
MSDTGRAKTHRVLEPGNLQYPSIPYSVFAIVSIRSDIRKAPAGKEIYNRDEIAFARKRTGTIVQTRCRAGGK